MKRLINLRRTHHRHRRGPQMRVQRRTEPVRRPVPRQIRMGHLPQRMHPGIGPPGPGHHGCRRIEARQRRLQRLLHARQAGLALPAPERPAVVFDAEGIARHGGPLARASAPAKVVPLRVLAKVTRWGPLRQARTRA